MKAILWSDEEKDSTQKTVKFAKKKHENQQNITKRCIYMKTFSLYRERRQTMPAKTFKYKNYIN